MASCSNPSKNASLSFTDDGFPFSDKFDDIYFNNDDGIAESRYVFLQQNDLPARWLTHQHPQFTIAETGFGTGLNFLLTWQAWREHAPKGQRLHFVSFEKYPLKPTDLQRALSVFPDLHDLAAQLIEAYPANEPGCHRRTFEMGNVTLDLWFGDVHDTLPLWLPSATATVDAWYLDGFAPSKNPDMWQPQLYQAMADSARSSATFATFTAAGHVRRGLQEVGFSVERVKGFGRKRQMAKGVWAHSAASASSDKGPIAIIGGGIAAATLASHLRQRGVAHQVLSPGVADGASGNPQAAIYPLLHVQRSPLAQFYVAAFGYAQHFYRQHTPNAWHQCGVVQLGFNADRVARIEKIAQPAPTGPDYDKATVCYFEAAQTQELWPSLPAMPSLYYQHGGWLNPQAVVGQLLAGSDKHVCGEIQSITAVEKGWQLRFVDGGTQIYPQVVLACGGGLKQLLEPFGVQLQNVRGQVTQVAANTQSQTCPHVVCYKGYFTPVQSQSHCVGATYARDDEDLALRTADDEENLTVLREQLGHPEWTQDLPLEGARAALRNTTRDHLPVVGAVAENLWVFGGLGSRGFTSAPLAASLLADQICADEPLGLSSDLICRLQVARLHRL